MDLDATQHEVARVKKFQAKAFQQNEANLAKVQRLYGELPGNIIKATSRGVGFCSFDDEDPGGCLLIPYSLAINVVGLALSDTSESSFNSEELSYKVDMVAPEVVPVRPS